MSNNGNHTSQTADSVIALNGSPTVSTHFSGSVSGRLDVPCGAIVHVHGVFEDALVSGAGMVRVSGLIAGVFSFDGGSVLARPGSVLAPEVDGEPWRVLHRSGTWTESVHPVFPDVVPAAADSVDGRFHPDDEDWWAVPA